jgi:hypothetical protein
MALVALLSARDGARDRLSPGAAGRLIDFGGQPLVEYQARLARACGVERVLIQVDAATPDLACLVDRVAADRGGAIALVQDMTSLARSLAPDDQVLLLAENLVVPGDALATLVVNGEPALLALPSVPATADFERIDGEAMWAGALCLPGRAVLATLDMLGDWDLALTVMRRAVQDGVRRLPVSPELVMDGRLTLVRDQASADLALEALSDTQGAAGAGASGGGLDGLMTPLAGPLVRELVRRQIEPARLAIVGLVVGFGALAVGLGGWMVAALLLMVVALALTDLARRTGQVTLRGVGAAWQRRLAHGGALGLLALAGYRLAQGDLLALAGAWLPLLLIGLMALADELAPVEGLWARWSRLTVTGALLLILAGHLFSFAATAFALLGLLAVATLALRLLPVAHAKV